MRWIYLFSVVMVGFVVVGCSSDGDSSSDGSSTTVVAVDTGPVEEAEAIVDVLSETYETRDATVLAEVFAPGVTYSDPTFDDEVEGAEEVIDFLDTWISTWDETYAATFEVSSDGSHIFDWGIWRGSGPVGEFDVEILALYEVEDGLVQTITIYYADPDVPASVYEAFGPPPG